MNPWIALIGKRESGRDAIARQLEVRLERAGVSVAGFHQEALGETGATKSDIDGYDVVRAGCDERVALARRSPQPELCDWGFDPKAFATSREWLVDSRAGVGFAVAGRLEAAERGHWSAITAAFEGPSKVLVLSIRPNVLASIALRLPDPVDMLELPADDDEVESFLDRVVGMASVDLAS